MNDTVILRGDLLPQTTDDSALSRAFDLGYEAGRVECDNKDTREAQRAHAERTMSRDCYGAWLDGFYAARESAHWNHHG